MMSNDGVYQLSLETQVYFAFPENELVRHFTLLKHKMDQTCGLLLFKWRALTHNVLKKMTKAKRNIVPVNKARGMLPDNVVYENVHFYFRTMSHPICINPSFIQYWPVIGR